MAAGPPRDAETAATESKRAQFTDPAPDTDGNADADTDPDAGASGPSRRRLLSAAAAGSVTALAGCTGAIGGEAPLRVSIWSGNYADRFEESVVPRYEAEHDVDVEIHRGWDEILTDIRSAPADDPPFDVTVAEGNFYYYGRQADLFEPIRTENLENDDEIIDFYREMRDTEYGLPVDGAPCTIIHREDMDLEFDSWSALAADAVQESAGIGVDTGFWWYPLYATAIAMDDEPGADEMHDPAMHDDVLETFEGFNVSSWASSGEDIWQAFDNGVIDVAQWYYDQTAYDIDDYDGLTHTMPEQTTGWLNNWSVVRGTDKRDEAEGFIDFLLDADVQSAWAEHAPLVFSNRNVDYPSELEADMPTTTEEAETIAFPDWETIGSHDDDLSEAFTAIQQGS
ncbi:spermidine/putrescine ABC transporter substrate-binding protein [Halobiforma lacisalsi AJ5]|uniref:Spermidine/putrescine ABC transporter substrate-binding protein n=2 Tax=Natronobacterium lacisalsi AJ5 TaxID=358396 RepID=A0A1P8LR30_NATLA|nr:extracellular solute-binding protein [Halobiforma lacisalsi]APW98257.1 spermidine/putrescine ABC transporter substrate-binding protein [Halobiforma lacisalsi AJ5]